jgi:motility quorum-sensing regulator/GCU-specific mRNA interferase toxin
MEKRKPTYDLAAIKAAIGAAETLSITSSALRDAVALGTHADHRVWQDVYDVPVESSR